MSKDLREPGLAHVFGPAGPALLDLTIGEALERAARRWPTHDAAVFVEDEVRYSFSELERLSGQAASALVRLGVHRGDRVAIWAPNCPAWVVIQYAVARIGAILVSINPAYRREELRHALRLSGTATLIVVPEFRGSDYLDMLGGLGVKASDGPLGAVACDEAPCLRSLFVIGGDGISEFASFETLLASASDDEGPNAASVAACDPSVIQFTSGTTGSPKGAVLSHASLVNNAYLCAQGQNLGPDDRLCIPVPLYHCFAQVLASIAGAVCGAAVVYPARAFDATATLRAIIEESCTAFYGVPTMLLGLLLERERSGAATPTLRTGIIGGAPCPQIVMERAIDELGLAEVTICYGMTETSPTIFQTRRDDDIARRTGTVGRVLPHLEARIVNADGHTANVDEPGEIAVRGHSVMIGYWENETETRAAIRDGWMMTGDIGVIDEAGYCRVSGRIKDIIIRGGENIAPREVEEVLHAHDAIADAHVFGIEDAILGEEVCAWIKLRDACSLDAQTLRAYCRERLSPYKIPRQIRFVDSFPTTVTGKVQKFVMRERMEAELSRPPVPVSGEQRERARQERTHRREEA